MTSGIFQRIGLGGLDLGYVLIGMLVLILVLLVMLVILMVQFSNLKKRHAKFMRGKDGKSLEKDIVSLYEDNQFLKSSVEKDKKDIRVLFKNMESAFQKVGIVKYDAFQQMGGKLSFSLALLNEKNDGFIINSVHSSDGCYSYTKEIRGGQSEISLGNEEKVALEIAMGEET